MTFSKHLYEGIFVAGLLAAVYLYVVAFDDFSETMLVRLSYLWIGALVFGTHGLIASEINAIIASGQAVTTREALQIRRQQADRSLFSKLSSAMLWSYRLTTATGDRTRPFLNALLATTIWIALLAFFFEAVFPAL